MKEDRVRVLRRILMQEKKVDCEDLCRRLGVSMATVRRDLTVLEREGTVRRFYGGAELTETADGPREPEAVPEWETREVANAAEKRAIARETAALITEGSTVFLDSGTTVYEVAKLLTKRSNLTVVTGALRNACILGMCPNIETYCIGGNIRPDMLFATGMLAAECLSYFPRIDYYVLSADGITPYGSLRDWSTENAMLKKAVISRTKTTIAAVDHSKFGLAASASVCLLKDIDVLVTGRRPADALYTRLTEGGTRIIVAEGDGISR